MSRFAAAAAWIGWSGCLHVAAADLQPQCRDYLESKGLSVTELKAKVAQCTSEGSEQEAYAPDPKTDLPGVIDTTPLSCRYGHPSLYGRGGKTCCGWKPHFNWVVATCDPNSHQEDSHFCKGLPACVSATGEDKCGAKVNYVAAYQYDGEDFVLLDESTAGELDHAGVQGSYNNGTGFERVKQDFAWKSGDWTSKFAPWGAGPTGPRGTTPPAMMWVLSAESFYYGAFYMLSQLTLNLEGMGHPTGTNCWNWELDPVEGALGWLPPGTPLPGNVNQLYSTNNAAVSGCMPVTYMASQANGLKREFSFPEQFREYCEENPTAAGCQPWVEDVMWSGGIHGTQRFENYANQAYVFAVVVDHQGYWIYRWIPDEETGATGWPGLERHKAARKLQKRPSKVTDARGLETDVPGDAPEAVVLQPSAPPEASCLRSSIEAVNFQFGAEALGSIAAELGESHPGGELEGAQNWWAHFADTGQQQGYPLSIAGLPKSYLANDGTCNEKSNFGCNCKADAKGTPAAPAKGRAESAVPGTSKAEVGPEERRLRHGDAAVAPRQGPVPGAKDIVKGTSYGPDSLLSMFGLQV